MGNLFLGRSLSSCLLGVILSVSYAENLDYVNMLVGTTGAHKCDYGGTTPAVGTPFAMTQWCAVTRENKISRTMYHYDDKSCLGFMATHQSNIWMGDFGFFTLMPRTDLSPVNNAIVKNVSQTGVSNGVDKLEPSVRAMPFDRKDEVATPYYYKLSYGNSEKITLEMTASSRASFFKVGYPSKTAGKMLFLEASRGASGGEIKIIPEKREVWIANSERHDAHLGSTLKNLKGYYVLKFNADFKNVGLFENGILRNSNCGKSDRFLCANIQFLTDSENVEIRIGSSFIGYEQARENLAVEIPESDSFENTAARVKTEWKKIFRQD